MTDAISSPARKPGPPFRASLAVLLIGIAIAIPGVVVAGITFLSLLATPSHTIPMTLHEDLGEGEYLVFERVGSTDRYGPVTFTHTRGVTLDPSQLTVIGPDGRRAPVEPARPNETVSRSGDQYVAALRIDVPESGRYDLEFRTRGRGKVIVSRSLGHTAAGLGGWWAVIGVGWLTALVGMVLLLTGVIRRGRADRRARRLAMPTWAPPAVPPPGWFPDPDGARTWRYWDGVRWTDHYAD